MHLLLCSSDYLNQGEDGNRGGRENLSKTWQKEKNKSNGIGVGGGVGGRVSRNQEGWQNKLKKKKDKLTAPEKLRQSKDTFEKNVLLYK